MFTQCTMEQMVEDIIRIGKITSRSTRMFFSAVKNIDATIERIESLLCSKAEICDSFRDVQNNTNESRPKSGNDCVFEDVQHRIRELPKIRESSIQQDYNLRSHGCESNKLLKDQNLDKMSMQLSIPIENERFLENTKDSPPPVEQLKSTITINEMNRTKAASEISPIGQEFDKNNYDIRGEGLNLPNSMRMDRETEVTSSIIKRQNLLTSIQYGVSLKKVNKEDSVSPNIEIGESLRQPCMNHQGNLLADIRNGLMLKSVVNNDEHVSHRKDFSSKGHQGNEKI